MHDGDGPTIRRVGGKAGSTRTLDLVVMHGLGGDDISTWTQKGSSESWLEWLVQDIPSIAVSALRYPAGLTKWTTAGEGMALPERANGLIETLLYHDIGSRPVIFVCHSLGGLVVKQILRNSSELAKPEWKVIAESTLGVVFLATPHSGSTLASIAKAVPLARPTRTTLALTAHCPHLKDLGDWYRQNVARLDIQTAAYAESQKVKRGFRLVTVVNSTSADPGIVDCVTTSVDADHSGICKPASRATAVYRGVEMFVRRQLARIPVNGVPLVPPINPPPEVVRQLREFDRLGELELLPLADVTTLKMGFLKRHYGVNDE
ncbi:esterase/lipase family protein [Actinophytocola glycyrrhizae]|uniref:Esterase/lipase family protein n=1 Tax=Actinophytocola glycyrrhizae TaxID=2044873 RepID=A0ABV9S8T0_9PSEU